MMEAYPGDRANGPGAWTIPWKGTDVTEATCAVEGCTKPGQLVRGWCTMHYKRWRRNGDPGEVTPRCRRGPESRSRDPECSQEGCAGKHYGLGLCRTHYDRLRMRGTLELLGHSGERSVSWVGDAIGYSGLHDRLRRLRGAAATYDCEHCDQPARQWAYDGQDPDERVSAWGSRYSVRAEHYMALCIPCHQIYDDLPVGQRGKPRRLKSGAPAAG